MNFDDMILISVDDHICEPASMFDAHVPARFRDQAPRVVEEAQGTQQWYYGEIRGRNLGLNAVAGKPPEMFNINPYRYEEMRPGCYDVHARVQDMSAGGQLAGLNFPNWPGFAGQVLNQGPDRDVNLIMIRAYNDWHVDEWCGAYPERFIPCGIVPLFDPEEAGKEIRRLAAKGCHAISFTDNPGGIDVPSIHGEFYDPMWAAASDEGTVICCHLGTSGRPLGLPADAPPLASLNMAAVLSVSTLVELIWARLWDRFPDLKFSITEGDTGWIPYYIERADWTYRRHNAWSQTELPGGLLPSEIFRRNLLVCFVHDPVGLELLHRFNTDNLFWECDYPHSETPWPYAPELLSDMFGAAGLSDGLVNKITHENALRHYQFDPFVHRIRQDCTVARLRAEAAEVDTVTRGGREAGDQDLAMWKAILTASAANDWSVMQKQGAAATSES